MVVYNHAFVSFASENGSLLEELAGHGHVVLAIEHREQLTEVKSLNQDRSSEKKANAELTQRLKRASRLERAELAPEYYAASTSTNRIVIERSRDVSFPANPVWTAKAKSRAPQCVVECMTPSNALGVMLNLICCSRG